jgi:hypothetical protein
VKNFLVYFILFYFILFASIINQNSPKMKIKFVLLFLLVFSFSTQASIISVPVSTISNLKQTPANSNWFDQMDAATFLSLTPAAVQKMTGKKLNLIQRLSLKHSQKSVQRQLKEGKEVNIAVMAKRAYGENFNWGTFALGFLLGPIGLIIVYLSYYDDRKVARRSAWLGFGLLISVSRLIFLLIG